MCVGFSEVLEVVLVTTSIRLHKPGVSDIF